MTDLTVVDTGNPAGPPIVWLGSIGSSTAMWDRQVPAFAADHRCVLVEHPGHGGSAPPDGPLTIDRIGAAVVEALDAAGVERAHFVGLSLGAMVSMSIAARSSGRVGRLALLCTSAYFGPDYGWLDRAAKVRGEGMSAVADATVGRWLTPGYAVAHPDEVASLVEMVMATNPDGYASCCEAIGEMDLRGDLPSVNSRTLVVAGTQDPATPPPHAETITNLITGARMETVDAAHLANWEQPGAINDLLRAHLEGANDV
jgi:3-oxoadipate enol-lactonase